VFAGGAMLGCHALARGEPLRVGHLFEGFQGNRFMPLCVLGLIWLALIFVVAVVMVATIFLSLGASGLAAIMDFGTANLDYSVLASAGFSLAVVGLIALALMLLVAMAYWFAPALVVLNGEDAVRRAAEELCRIDAQHRRVPAVRHHLHRPRDRRIHSDGARLARARPDGRRQLLRGLADDLLALTLRQR
jgi:hypothetical protein